MRTAIIIAAGFALLGIFVLVGRALNGAAGMAHAALLFVPVWFVAASANLAIGVLSAGYSVAEEAPILLVIFAPPAAVAFYFWKKWGG
jgi:hypothetical protein